MGTGADTRVYLPHDRHELTISFEAKLVRWLPAGMHPDTPEVRAMIRVMRRDHAAFVERMGAAAAGVFGGQPSITTEHRVDPILEGDGD